MDTKDFVRCEGVYVTTEVYPRPPMVGGITLTKIERVNGDCSVSSLSLTQDETKDLIEQLQAL